MSQLDTRFQEHGIHSKLQSLRDDLDSIPRDFKEPITITYVNRITHVLQYVQTILTQVESSLVPTKSLNQMLQVMTDIETDLTKYKETKDEVIFETTNNRADSVLLHLSNIPRIQSPDDLSALVEGINRLRSDVSSYLDYVANKAEIIGKKLDERISELDIRLSSTESTIETQKGRLDSAITEFQSRSLSSESERKKEFDELIKSKSQEFENAMTSHKEKLESAIEDIENKLEATTTQLDNATKETLKLHSQKAQENEKFLQSKVDEAKQLVHVIGNVGVTGEFAETARREREAANRLRFYSLVFMIITVIIILTIVIKTAVAGVDWKLVAFRMSASLILLVPAYYLARESTIHRKREQHTRKMALELASIDPYLELLPEEKKIELKSQLTERYFGQPDSAPETISNPDSKELIKVIGEVLRNLTKR
jgi:hypothetical protein